MTYSQNPHLPQVRMEAVRLVKYRGWSMRKVARRLGVEASTVSRWCAHPWANGWVHIPTKSSRPHHHPDELSAELVDAVLRYRLEYRRCAKVLHHLLRRDGYELSLSSVERVLRRKHLIDCNYRRKVHHYPPRPVAEKPGTLVEIDTIVDGPHTDRLYVYTLLDVCSRFAFAAPALASTTHNSITFLEAAREELPFFFGTIQSDHGSEFSRRFTERVLLRGMSHRHSRIRTPTDNGHVERFNRTIQEECLNRVPRTLRSWRKEIPGFLHFYNTERPHMGLNMQTPASVAKLLT